MKHGIVHNGRSTTYYGNDATRYLAHRSAVFTFSKKEAAQKLRNAMSVGFRMLLAEELKAQGYSFSETYLKRLNKKTEAEEKKHAEEQLAHQKGQLRQFPTTTKPTSSKCVLCRKPIKKGTEYHDGEKGNRAHVVCAAK